MVKYSFKQILVIWKIQIDYYWYYYLSNAAVSDKSFFIFFHPNQQESDTNYSILVLDDCWTQQHIRIQVLWWKK